MINLPQNATIGEIYGPAMKITEKDQADEYFEAIVLRLMKTANKERSEAEDTARSNLGYYAGYYDNKTREQVKRLFLCAHPVFGAIAKGSPTPEEAFRMGQNGER